MRTPRLAPMLLLAALVAGCVPRYTPPEIRFDGVRLGGLGLRGGTVYAQLHVLNPNRFDVRTSRLTYDLELSADPERDDTWFRLAEGTFAEQVEVRGHDSTTIEVPIDFTYQDLGGAIRSVLDRGTVDYRVRGSVQVTDPVRRNVPYRHRGKVSFGGVR